MKQSFFSKNKVFILGGLLAILQVITSFVSDVTQDVQLAAIGYAVLVTVLNYVARNWRGQTSTIVSSILTTAGIVGAQLELGHEIKLLPFLLGLLATFLVQYIAASMPDAKSVGYEHTPVITQAKKAGEVIQPAALTNKGT